MIIVLHVLYILCIVLQYFRYNTDIICYIVSQYSIIILVLYIYYTPVYSITQCFHCGTGIIYSTCGRIFCHEGSSIVFLLH